MRTLPSAFAALLAVGLIACGEAPSQTRSPDQTVSAQDPKPKLGLMTSLPLYWPLGADFSELAGGDAEVPGQRAALEEEHELVLLDTLSPIAGLTEDAPETDPLEGLERLAVIQPRGLSPADNVALDEWVRGGGQLLLVLDPYLGGHYPLPLGDPRLPNEVALIPPVVERWGLVVYADDALLEVFRATEIEGALIPVISAGEVREVDASVSNCQLFGEGLAARCQIGEGRVTLVADAEAFKDIHSPEGHAPPEHDKGDHYEDDHGGEAGEGLRTPAIQALLRLAFEND